MKKHDIQRITVDQNVFTMLCGGEGSPTVVLDTGLGDDLTTWSTIFDELASLTSTFCYNRLKIRKSGSTNPSFSHRTSEQMVRELHALLKEGDIRPPYLLLGHSLGGLNMQLFASRYSHEVAALVLLDPGTSNIIPITEELLGSNLAQYIWQRGFEQRPEGMRFSDYLESCLQVAQALPLPPIPVKVLSATLAAPAPPESTQLVHTIMRAMQRAHALLVQQTSHAEHNLVPMSGHYIHKDRPDIVLQVIRTIVEMELPIF